MLFWFQQTQQIIKKRKIINKGGIKNMEHHKGACELCIFEEKCSSYQKREEVNCLFFIDNNFSDIYNLSESLPGFLLSNDVFMDGSFRWGEMSWNQDVYGVRRYSLDEDMPKREGLKEFYGRVFKSYDLENNYIESKYNDEMSNITKRGLFEK